MNIIDKKLITCRNDRAFKEIFMNEDNKDILICLLESVLNIKIKELTYLNLEKNVDNINIRRKYFDLHVKTETENIQIEVNGQVHDYLRPRNTAFICKTYSNVTLKGANYNENVKVIQINFTYGLESEFKNDKGYRIYKIRDEDNKCYVENFTIYEFDMDYYNDIWYSGDEEKILNNKYLIMMDLDKKDLNKLSKEDKVVEKYMCELERVNEDPDFIEYISAEKDNEMIENSLKIEYRRKALEEGLAEGRAEGLELGRAEEKIETAKKMKEDGMDYSLISKYTNISLEQIEKL